MPLIDPGLIARARGAAEKQALLLPTLVGAGLGAGLAPPRNMVRGALRGAGVGLTTGVGAPLGGLAGLAAGGLGGTLGGAALGGIGGLVQQALQGGGHIDPETVARFAASGGILGGTAGGTAGALGGGVLGGIKGFQLGKRHIWDQPWEDDRERPHGVSGADPRDDDDDLRGKAASFAARLGALAARTRT